MKVDPKTNIRDGSPEELIEYERRIRILDRETAWPTKADAVTPAKKIKEKPATRGTYRTKTKHTHKHWQPWQDEKLMAVMPLILAARTHAEKRQLRNNFCKDVGKTESAANGRWNKINKTIKTGNEQHALVVKNADKILDQTAAG